MYLNLVHRQAAMPQAFRDACEKKNLHQALMMARQLLYRILTILFCNHWNGGRIGMIYFLSERMETINFSFFKLCLRMNSIRSATWTDFRWTWKNGIRNKHFCWSSFYSVFQLIVWVVLEFLFSTDLNISLSIFIELIVRLQYSIIP